MSASSGTHPLDTILGHHRAWTSGDVVFDRLSFAPANQQ